MTANSNRRYAYIDSLRALAAFSVIYYHTALHYVFYGKTTSDAEYVMFYISTVIFDFGKVGVIIFFAISGFVVPFSLLRARNRPIISFAISRIFRLYPAYWASIAAAILVLQPNFDTAKIIANLFMIQQFIGIENIQGLYWTLQIELVFYILCAAFFYFGLLNKNRNIIVIATCNLMLALVMAIARFYLEKQLPVAIPLSLAIMFWGILWRRQILENDAEAKRFSMIFLIVFSSLIFPISYFGYQLDETMPLIWLRYVSTYYLALIIFVLFTKYIHLNSPFLSYLGTLSYSIYLFGSISSVIVTRFIGYSLFGISHLQIIISCALASLIAYVVYNLIEAPAIRLGHFLSANVQNTPARVRSIEPGA